MKVHRQGLFSALNPRDVAAVAAELRPGDGIDPREEAKQRRREAREERGGEGHGAHKQEQFLAQVQSAIESALQSAASPLLNQLAVAQVTSQGGSLVVLLTPQEEGQPMDLLEAGRVVECAASMLRREVAAAITRKETPHLTFLVLPADAQRVDA